jgi:hypothetical protein
MLHTADVARTHCGGTDGVLELNVNGKTYLAGSCMVMQIMANVCKSHLPAVWQCSILHNNVGFGVHGTSSVPKLSMELGP